jgi:hypothetical protein
MIQPDELKPCPFCGGEAKEETRSIDSWIYCTKCGLSTSSKTVLVKKDYDCWNTRTPDQQAYDRAMADEDITLDTDWEELDKQRWVLISEALNATEADAEAWLKTHDAAVTVKVLQNSKLHSLKEAQANQTAESAMQVLTEKCKELATVTNERDALRDMFAASTDSADMSIKSENVDIHPLGSFLKRFSDLMEVASLGTDRNQAITLGNALERLIRDAWIGGSRRARMQMKALAQKGESPPFE